MKRVVEKVWLARLGVKSFMAFGVLTFGKGWVHMGSCIERILHFQLLRIAERFILKHSGVLRHDITTKKAA
jgi:hypothetical protein